MKGKLAASEGRAGLLNVNHRHWASSVMAATVLAAQSGSAAAAATPSATAPSGGEVVASDFGSLVKALKGHEPA